MKVAILTDTHFGEKPDSPRFYRYYKKFLDEVFFPQIDKHDIKYVLHGGDLFHNRQSIDMRVWRWTQENFLDPLEKRGVAMYGIIGNHDIYYKASSEINSPQEMLIAYPEFQFWQEPTTLTLGSMKFLLLPWIHSRNEEMMKEYLQNHDAHVVLGHLELAGCAMHPGIYAERGQPVENDLKKFPMVLSGHFHTQSTKGNVKYLGSPVEFNWNDFQDAKGMHLIDTETGDLTFHQNPYRLFKKLYIDGTESTDPEQHRDCIVRLIIQEGVSRTYVDSIVQKLNETAWDVKVIDDDRVRLNSESQDAELTEGKSTLDIIRESVHEADTNLDKQRLVRLFHTLYTEAEATRHL